MTGFLVKLPPEVVTAVIDDLKAHHTIAETARRHGLNDYKVRRIATAAGITPQRGTPGRPTINIRSPAAPKLNGIAPDWTRDAACFGVDDAVFYPTSGDPAAAQEAKAICADCPVQSECLEHALTIREGHGIWGGLTAYERDRLLRHTTQTGTTSDTTVSQEGTA